MESLKSSFEQLMLEAALAEERAFPSPLDELRQLLRVLQCSFVDVAFAEEDDFTESACAV